MKTEKIISLNDSKYMIISTVKKNNFVYYLLVNINKPDIIEVAILDGEQIVIINDYEKEILVSLLSKNILN